MKKFRIEKEHQRMKISQYLREVQNYSGRSLRNVEVFLNGKQVRLTKKLPSHGNLRVVEKKKGTDIKGTKTEVAVAVGKRIAEKAKAAGYEKVVFDRNGYLYHGVIAAFAEALRENGIKL